MPRIDLIQQVQGILQVEHGGTGLNHLPPYAQVLFADAEIPSGLQNSSNTVFTWAYPPNPALSLICTKNGNVLRQGVGKDYTLLREQMTLAVAPAPSDMIQGWYRYVLMIAEEDYWVNWTVPQLTFWQWQQQWPLDTQEPYLFKFIGSPDEDYWQNYATPVLTFWKLPQQWQFDVPEPAGHLFGFTGSPDEDYWINSVRPIPASLRQLPQWPFDEQTREPYWLDEEAWQNPSKQQPRPQSWPQQWTFDPSDLL